MDKKAFVLFTIGPVQGFIKASRTTRDLWSGSYLLSYLTYRAMKAVADKAGSPETIIFPNMRDLPLWKWKVDGKKKPAHESVLQPCIPNRFLAEVQADTPDEFAKAAEDGCRAAWQEIASAVHNRIKTHRLWNDSYDTIWNAQIKSFWEIYTLALPMDKFSDELVKALLAKPMGIFWADRHAIAQKMLASLKGLRYFPSYAPQFLEGKVPAKDNLLGTLEHVGPGDRKEANEFWEEAHGKGKDQRGAWHFRGSKVGKNERLCAISLVKRFAWAWHFSESFGLNPQELRYEDTATVAAAKWLRKGDLLDPDAVRHRHRDAGWSGQWLHWPSQDPSAAERDDEDSMPDEVWNKIKKKKKEQGNPPTYYALFMFDVDKMGDRFNAAENAESYRKISATLAEFALKRIGQIVTKHLGELIYAGGDDALCMLPTETALDCVKEINEAFADNWSRSGISGDPVTISGGLVVAHFKEDLRFVLDRARDAEKDAKKSGRDALCITVCRRSGEHTSAIVKWPFLPTMISWVRAFLDKASDRWAYKLREQQDVLESLIPDALTADPIAVELEIERQLGRAEEATTQKLPPPQAASSFREYRKQFSKEPLEHPLHDFLTLVLAASFLARGRDA